MRIQNFIHINRKKTIGIATGVMIIVFALMVGISAYSAAPGNKLSRQLDLGNKYLEDGEYKAAAVAFENAIAIDEKCMEAYAGGIEAYLLIGDKDVLLTFYDRALSAVSNLDAGSVGQKTDFIVEIYLASDRVYSDDWEMKIRILEEGWNITENEKIKEMLIVKYLDIAEEKSVAEDYESGLECFDRLLKLAAEDGRVLETLERCLNAYLECLVEEKNYDEVRKLAEKYKEIATNIDFNAILKQMEEQATREKEAALREEEKRKEQEDKELWEEKPQEIEEEDTVIGENEVSAVENALQGGTWVDDLYNKIIAEDVEAVFAIMEQSDFIERCEKFSNTFLAWSTDYNLSTSDGKNIWVVKGSESSFLSVAYYPNGYNYGAPDNVYGELLGAPATGWGDYVFEFNHEGKKEWLIKSIAYLADGSIIELSENSIWEVYHM